MQKIKLRVVLIVFLIILSVSNISLATQDEILKSQYDALNIKQFVSQANTYTKEVFDGIDANELMNSAIKGKIDNKSLINKILNLFGKEIGQTLKIVRKYYSSNCST